MCVADAQEREYDEDNNSEEESSEEEGESSEDDASKGSINIRNLVGSKSKRRKYDTQSN